MGYDRDAAKRTAVIDDQSDFFEIDSNAWLTPQARLALTLDYEACRHFSYRALLAK